MSKEPQFSIGDKIYRGFEFYTGLEVCEATVTAVWTQETAFDKEFFYDIQCTPDGDIPIKLHTIREQELSTTEVDAWRKLQAHLRGDLASARKRVTELAERLDKVSNTIQDLDPCEDCPMQSYKHCGQCRVTKERLHDASAHMP